MRAHSTTTPEQCPWCREAEHRDYDDRLRLFACGMQFHGRDGTWSLYFKYPGGQLATFVRHLKAQSEREGIDAPLADLVPGGEPPLFTPAFATT
jgi:hypothetical protein